MTDDEVFADVCRVLANLDLAGVLLSNIRRDTLLVEDLGLDSLKFVDLTVGLEDAFGFEAFPMQEWVDAQVARGESLSVNALVDECTSVLGSSSQVASS